MARLCVGEGVSGWQGGGRPYLKIVICDLKDQNALVFKVCALSTHLAPI